MEPPEWAAAPLEAAFTAKDSKIQKELGADLKKKKNPVTDHGDDAGLTRLPIIAASDITGRAATQEMMLQLLYFAVCSAPLVTSAKDFVPANAAVFPITSL